MLGGGGSSAPGPACLVFDVVSWFARSARRLHCGMKVQCLVAVLIAGACSAADPCDSTAPPEPAPTPAPTAAPTPAPSSDPCDTTVAPGPSPGPGPKPGPGPGKKAMVGGLIAGATALAVAGGIMAKSTTPGPVTTASATTQGAQSTAVTTTTENSSSSLLWLWILLGILALCCLLALCGG